MMPMGLACGFGALISFLYAFLFRKIGWNGWAWFWLAYGFLFIVLAFFVEIYSAVYNITL